MSISQMAVVWRIEWLSSTQKLVLLSLADNANDQGECYPSMAQIARRTCLTDRSVRMTVRAFEEMGIVRSFPRRGTSTLYRLMLTGISLVEPPASLAEASEPRSAPERRSAPETHSHRNRVPPASEAHSGAEARSEGNDIPPPSEPPSAHPRNDVPPTPEPRSPKPSLNRQGTTREPPKPSGGLPPAVRSERASKAGSGGKQADDPGKDGVGTPVWRRYAAAYKQRYGVDPVRNAKANALCAQLVRRLGDVAPDVAAFYLGHNKTLYQNARHALELLVRDAEGLHTDMQLGFVTDPDPEPPAWVRERDRREAGISAVLSGVKGLKRGSDLIEDFANDDRTIDTGIRERPSDTLGFG